MADPVLTGALDKIVELTAERDRYLAALRGILRMQGLDPRVYERIRKALGYRQ